MNKAFSLIELLIVISIVGILSAIAVPAYQSYTQRAKISAAMNIVNSYVDQSKVYYGKHGQFATLQDLGEPTDVNNPAQAAGTFPPNSFSDYVKPPYVMTYQVTYVDDNVYTCPGGRVTAWISNINGIATTADTTLPLIFIEIGIVDYNNTLSTMCIYTYQEDGSQKPGNYLPNCINQADFPAAAVDFNNMWNACP